MEDVVVGINIGTTKVCSLVGQVDKMGQLQIMGKGIMPLDGVKRGIIVDIDSTSKAIRFAKEKAESSANLRFNSAYINIYGAHVNVINYVEKININSENRVITQKDLNTLYDAAEALSIPEDSQIIDIIPRQYIIDGYGGILDPIGMSGFILEAEMDVITAKLASVQNIIRSVERAGLETDGLVLEAYATSEIALSPEEKEMGVILIDVGGGITDVSAFKNGKLIMCDSIPVGGNHITNDVSIGLNISYGDADKIKRQYELVLTSLIKNDQEITIYDIKEEKEKDIYISEIIEIIEARVTEILSLAKVLVEEYKNIDEFKSGVVLTGGGISYMDGGKQIGEGVFELPVRVAAYKTTNSIIKPEIAAAAGIIKHVSRRNKGSRASANSDKEVLAEDKNKFKEFLKKIIQGIKDWFF